MSTPERWTTCRHHGGSWFEGGRLPPYCAASPDSCDRVSYVLEAAHEAALVEARTQAAREIVDRIEGEAHRLIAESDETDGDRDTAAAYLGVAEWVRSGSATEVDTAAPRVNEPGRELT